MQGMLTNKYKSSFVASGSTQGDLNAKATVVMPKVQTGRMLAPPPVPISQQPLYLRRQQQGFTAPQSGAESTSAQQVASCAVKLLDRIAAICFWKLCNLVITERLLAPASMQAMISRPRSAGHCSGAGNCRAHVSPGPVGAALSGHSVDRHGRWQLQQRAAAADAACVQRAGSRRSSCAGSAINCRTAGHRRGAGDCSASGGRARRHGSVPASRRHACAWQSWRLRCSRAAQQWLRSAARAGRRRRGSGSLRAVCQCVAIRAGPGRQTGRQAGRQAER